LTLHYKVETSVRRDYRNRSQSDKRTIPIPDILLPELKALKAEPYYYIFKNQNGSHMTTAGIRTRWRSSRELWI